MLTPLEALVKLLDIETIEENLFRGVSPPETPLPRVYGGQVAAQALVAAARTVTQGNVHSLHCYFLRPGDIYIPIVFEVDRIHDGRSFSTRRVVAIQKGRAIFNLEASFQIEERGLEHQIAMPDVPKADDLPTLADMAAKLPKTWRFDPDRPRPFDQRFVGALPWDRSAVPREPRQQLWIKATGALPDDHLIHTAVATYLSDMSLFDPMLFPHDITWGDPRFVMGASIDHCMWFHRPFRADEWLLYDQESPAASGARGLTRASMFTEDGTLAISVVQEGLIRIDFDKKVDKKQ